MYTNPWNNAPQPKINMPKADTGLNPYLSAKNPEIGAVITIITG